MRAGRDEGGCVLSSNDMMGNMEMEVEERFGIDAGSAVVSLQKVHWP